MRVVILRYGVFSLFSLSALSLTLAFSVQDNAGDAPVFEFDGKPIHPFLLRQFYPPWAGEGPIYLAVDVAAAASGVEARARTEQQGHHLTYKPENLEQGWFGYSVLGSDGNTFVLRLAENGGGTGVFTTLAIIRRERLQLEPGAAPRDVLHLRKLVPLGDRDDGLIEVRNGVVHVGPSRHRPQEMVIRLNGE